VSRLRFFLILVLTIALDFSSPVPTPHAVAEVVEEFEEATHRHRAGRRPFRVARETTPSALGRETVVARRPPVRHVAVAPMRRSVSDAPVRKQPPPVAESSSAPDAH
jgi:hypothetical protein